MIYKIYKLINDNKVVYVGRTKMSLSRRKRGGYWKNTEFFRKCSIELIEETEDISRERYWIEYYRNLGQAIYNSKDGDGFDLEDWTRKTKNKKVMKTKLMLGDNIISLKKLPDNSVDSVVTDSPYGLSAARNSGKTSTGGFMNKKWDYEVPTVEFWKEVYRVLKPGGHVLSFGGTRTYHRMVINIEDAGFEIRDQIMWIYGSGFPKSLNVGKAYDKMMSNEREVVGGYIRGDKSNFEIGASGIKTGEYDITKGTSPYEGIGTSLKPAQEIVTVAQKPENLEGTALNLIYIIKNELWKLYVCVVEKNLELNQVEQKEVLNTAQCLVEKNTNIQDALQGLMGMLRLRLMESLNLNTVLLWHNILEDLSQKMSRYTISTKLNVIIDLKTLKSLEWQNILENITQANDNQIDGLNVNALTAVVLFNALNLKLETIQTHSVEDNVIYKENKRDSQNEPICMARKPLSEKTIVDNVIKWGTGGINIDDSRIGTEDGDKYKGETIITGKRSGVFLDENGNTQSGHKRQMLIKNDVGRFPANILFDETAAQMLDSQSGISKSSIFPGKGGRGFGAEKNSYKNHKDGGSLVFKDSGYTDKGGASRFFFNAKNYGGREDFFIYKEKNIIIWNTKSLNTQEYKMEECIEVSDALRQARENILQRPELYGNNTMVKYLLNTISITKMKTHSIMTFSILNVYTKMNIGHFTLMIEEKQSHLLMEENILNVQIVNNQNALVSSIETNQEVLVPIVNYVLEEDLENGETIIENTIINTTENTEQSRFFYVAKVSKKERNLGLDNFEDKEENTPSSYKDGIRVNNRGEVRDKVVTKNNHPTLKPINLMTYLIKLVTPKDGIILDPFMGSGSTGIAAQLEGHKFIGMEMDEDYFKIAEQRIKEFEQYRTLLKK